MNQLGSTNQYQPINFSQSQVFSCGFPAAGFPGEGEEEEEEEDVPEDLADLEPEEQQKRIKPMPWMPRNHVVALRCVFVES